MSKRRFISFITFLLPLMLTAGCAQTDEADYASKASAGTSSKVNGTSFALKLFAEAVKSNKDNVLVSPFSAYTALSMSMNGADGHTFKQMMSSLSEDANSLGEINKRNEKILDALNSNSNVQLQIANAIFVNENAPFRQSFVDVCKRVYHAEARSENFTNPTTVNDINSWCSQKTNGKISQIIQGINPDAEMLLLNAIYFNGNWAMPFEKSETLDDKFQTESGSQVPVMMMHQQHEFGYLQVKDFQLLRLPYAGIKQSMYILLPRKGVHLSTVEASFSKDMWKRWTSSCRETLVDLSLPRFRIESTMRLDAYLQAIGITDAFESSRANFSKLSSSGACISEVLQKVFMEVNEQGTEASAATAVKLVEIELVEFREPQSVHFRVDRPFALVVVDDESDEILFLGSIVKP